MAAPRMTAVDSSNLQMVGYDGDTQKLWVQFKNGDVYAYGAVPSYMFQDLLNSTSRGTYFHQYIKGKFAYEKMAAGEGVLPTF